MSGALSSARYFYKLGFTNNKKYGIIKNAKQVEYF